MFLGKIYLGRLLHPNLFRLLLSGIKASFFTFALIMILRKLKSLIPFLKFNSNGIQ